MRGEAREGQRRWENAGGKHNRSAGFGPEHRLRAGALRPSPGRRRPWGGGRQDGGAGGAKRAAAALRRRALRVAALRPLRPRWARCPCRAGEGGGDGQGGPGGASARRLPLSGWSGGAGAAGGADLRRAAWRWAAERCPLTLTGRHRCPGAAPCRSSAWGAAAVRGANAAGNERWENKAELEHQHGLSERCKSLLLVFDI